MARGEKLVALKGRICVCLQLKSIARFSNASIPINKLSTANHFDCVAFAAGSEQDAFAIFPQPVCKSISFMYAPTQCMIPKDSYDRCSHIQICPIRYRFASLNTTLVQNCRFLAGVSLDFGPGSLSVATCICILLYAGSLRADTALRDDC